MTEVRAHCQPAGSARSRQAAVGPLAAWQVLGGTLAKADIFDWHCHDPSATQSFAETYVRRLEGMRRADAGIGCDRAGPDIGCPTSPTSPHRIMMSI